MCITQKRFLGTKFNKSLLPNLSIQERNGPDASTKLETKHLAVHVGLSVLQKLSQIDSASLQKEKLTSCFPHKTWFPATKTTSPVMVAILLSHGNTLKTKVLLPKNAIHTSQAKVTYHPAQQSAMMVLFKRSTSARRALLSKPVELRLPSNSFKRQVQLRLDSPYILTSSTTRAVFTHTCQAGKKVVTLLKLLAGAKKVTLTTGSVPTLGANPGEKMVTSRSNKATPESMMPLSVALQMLTLFNPSSSNEQKLIVEVISKSQKFKLHNLGKS